MKDKDWGQSIDEAAKARVRKGQNARPTRIQPSSGKKGRIKRGYTKHKGL